jgi:hypothetical protein
MSTAIGKHRVLVIAVKWLELFQDADSALVRCGGNTIQTTRRIAVQN